MTGGGVARGYAYRLVGDRLEREPSATDCNCGDPLRHEHHMQALCVLEEMMGDSEVVRAGNVISVRSPA